MAFQSDASFGQALDMVNLWAAFVSFQSGTSLMAFYRLCMSMAQMATCIAVLSSSH